METFLQKEAIILPKISEDTSARNQRNDGRKRNTGNRSATKTSSVKQKENAVQNVYFGKGPWTLKVVQRHLLLRSRISFVTLSW